MKKQQYYIQFRNGFILKGLTELEMYKTLVKGYYDEDGRELEVECYGEY